MRGYHIYRKLGAASLAVLDVSHVELNLYEVNRINVPPKFRGSGIARDLAKSMIEWADSEMNTLRLVINPSGDMDFDQLEAWYERLGFHKQDTGWYIRPPRRRNGQAN